jgi:hypothetical protein
VPFTKDTARSAGRKGNQKRQAAERRYEAHRAEVAATRSQLPPSQFPGLNALVSHAEKWQFFSETQPDRVEILSTHPKGCGTLLWCSCGNATVALEAVCMDGHRPTRMRVQTQALEVLQVSRGGLGGKGNSLELSGTTPTPWPRRHPPTQPPSASGALPCSLKERFRE